MNTLIIDIETKGSKSLLPIFQDKIKAPSNWKDENKIKAFIDEKLQNVEKEMAVDPDYAKIVCIGVKELGGETRIIFNDENFSKNLIELLDIFRTSHIITFNGKGFDIPLLIKTAIKLDLPVNLNFLKGMMKKWSADNGHYDLMEIISDGREWKSLDTYTQIYLGEKKTNLSDDFFRKATAEELAEHCKEDLLLTEKLYKKFINLIA